MVILKCDAFAGAVVVLSKLPIGDVATQWFADREMFCAGRVAEEDLKRTMKACGGSIQVYTLSKAHFLKQIDASATIFNE